MSIVGMNANNLDTKRGIHRDFLATHPLVFADATDPLEANSWLRTMESKVWANSLYKVSEDFVCNAATQRLSWSLVGYIHCHPTC
jgi:hypothetical protein